MFSWSFFFRLGSHGIHHHFSPPFGRICLELFARSQVKINIKHQNTLELPLHNIKTLMNEHRKMLLWQNVSSFWDMVVILGSVNFRGSIGYPQFVFVFCSLVGFPVNLCVKRTEHQYTPPKTNMSPKKVVFSVANTSSNHWLYWFVRGHVSFAGQYHTSKIVCLFHFWTLDFQRVSGFESGVPYHFCSPVSIARKSRRPIKRV